ncbi:hypothetical protein V2G26_009754 [Clonostachys chloroleuca]|uniref:Uncharacterized protein n=1 Tax=Clonostachys chloroleuca TaxID=1926264 RepID=A0AA35LYR2_9HYPO|nr:unnamed protein product [Clonostachys chloroleuca]
MMKFSLFFINLSLTSVLARPSLETRSAPVQVAHLTFHAGPASYDLAVPADGTEVFTNSDLSVSIIDAPDYNAGTQCFFKTDGEKTIVHSIDTSDGSQHLIIGPPQPVRSVICQGMCVPTYGECYGSDGQYIGPCCNGFCAATRCRPWNIGN